jgi:hypothetical protein
MTYVSMDKNSMVCIVLTFVIANTTSSTTRLSKREESVTF